MDVQIYSGHVWAAADKVSRRHHLATLAPDPPSLRSARRDRHLDPNRRELPPRQSRFPALPSIRKRATIIQPYSISADGERRKCRDDHRHSDHPGLG